MATKVNAQVDKGFQNICLSQILNISATYHHHPHLLYSGLHIYGAQRKFYRRQNHITLKLIYSLTLRTVKKKKLESTQCCLHPYIAMYLPMTGYQPPGHSIPSPDELEWAYESRTRRKPGMPSPHPTQPPSSPTLRCAFEQK